MFNRLLKTNSIPDDECKNAYFNSLPCIFSVSYTHLDVYKRQTVACATIRSDKEMLEGMGRNVTPEYMK